MADLQWTPVRWDITIPAGADFEDFITWKDSTGTPVDLTGFTAKQEFRRTFGDTEALVTLTDTDGLTLDGASGKIYIAIPHADTALLGDVRTVTVVTALEVTSSAGKVYRLFDGVWTVTPEATK